jgi:hypothetical protein
VNSDFETHRKRWIDCLGNQDGNSLIEQAYEMVQQAGIYLALIESRRLEEETEQ